MRFAPIVLVRAHADADAGRPAKPPHKPEPDAKAPPAPKISHEQAFEAMNEEDMETDQA